MSIKELIYRLQLLNEDTEITVEDETGDGINLYATVTIPRPGATTWLDGSPIED